MIMQSEKSVKLADDIKEMIIVEQKKIAETQNRFDTLQTEINKSLKGIGDISDKTNNLNDIKGRIVNEVEELRMPSGPEQIVSSEYRGRA